MFEFHIKLFIYYQTSFFRFHLRNWYDKLYMVDVIKPLIDNDAYTEKDIRIEVFGVIFISFRHAPFPRAKERFSQSQEIV